MRALGRRTKDADGAFFMSNSMLSTSAQEVWQRVVSTLARSDGQEFVHRRCTDNVERSLGKLQQPLDEARRLKFGRLQRACSGLIQGNVKGGTKGTAHHVDGHALGTWATKETARWRTSRSHPARPGVLACKAPSAQPLARQRTGPTCMCCRVRRYRSRRKTCERKPSDSWRLRNQCRRSAPAGGGCKCGGQRRANWPWVGCAPWPWPRPP